MKIKKLTIENLIAAVDRKAGRSAWDKGLRLYALELLDNLKVAIDCGDFDTDNLWLDRCVRGALLNGASDWQQYSEGGCSLIYNCDIANRLCNATELRKCKNGQLNPNPRENWIDCQARALRQAESLIIATLYELREKVKKANGLR